MRLAICYFSSHHENTLRLLEALDREDVDLIDVRLRMAFRPQQYDAIGFASGIYYGRFHESVLQFAKQYCPADKPVFLLYTCGMKRRGYTDAIRSILTQKGARPVGEYGCRGFDTFGPFRWIGGIAKGHPDRAEIEGAQRFLAALFPKEENGNGI